MGQLEYSIGVFWQFNPRDTLRYNWIFQLKSNNRLIFAHIDQKSSVFGIIIANLTENGAFYAI